MKKPIKIFLSSIISIAYFCGITQSVKAYPPGYALPFIGEVNITCLANCENGSHMNYGNVDTSNAIDFQADGKQSFPVYATGPGRILIDVTADFGMVIRIIHSDGLQSFYAHLDGNLINVNDGQQVSMGDLIGYTGSSGSGGIGNHLHFEIRQDEKPVGGSSGVYSGISIKIDDNPNINLSNMTAFGDGRAFFSTPKSLGELDFIPEDALSCDAPLPPTDGLCTNDFVNFVPCGFGLKANGEHYTGNEVCAREGLGSCEYVPRDGGVVCSN